jgi:hypothetical protein
MAPISKEPVGHVENPGAESANNFRERTFILCTRLARQFEFGGLFVTVRQKRSLWSAPAERSGDGALDELIICSLPVRNQLERDKGRSRAPSSLRSAGALQMVIRLCAIHRHHGGRRDDP